MNSISALDLPLLTVFKKVFRILLVDDEEIVLNLARSLFNELELFELDTAHSAKQADRLLSQHTYHICICDLGITDIFGDQYYLLKKHNKKLPILILSGHASMEESACCMAEGALWVFDKPETMDQDFFGGILGRFLPHSLFMYGTTGDQHARYREAVEALFNHKPDSVEEWARIINVNERYLRKIGECCSLPLHHMISVCNLVDLALNDNICNPASSRCDETCAHYKRCKKIAEFYYLNKKAIDSFMRIKRVEWNPANLNDSSKRP